jgi:hypothetical protein
MIWVTMTAHTFGWLVAVTAALVPMALVPVVLPRSVNPLKV